MEPLASNLQTIWEHAQNEDWFSDHPLRERILAEPQRYVPMRLHGGDAYARGQTGIYVFNMSGVNSRQSSWRSRILLVCLATVMVTGAVSYNPLVAAIAWSFALFAAEYPVHPKADHLQNAWTSERRRLRAGSKLLQGLYRLVLTEVVGTGNS